MHFRVTGFFLVKAVDAGAEPLLQEKLRVAPGIKPMYERHAFTRSSYGQSPWKKVCFFVSCCKFCRLICTAVVVSPQ